MERQYSQVKITLIMANKKMKKNYKKGKIKRENWGCTKFDSETGHRHGA